jgi:hypothetical protein
VHPLFPQASEGTGLKSLADRPATAGEHDDALVSAREISAWSAAAEQRRRMDWLAISLPLDSSHLFARLPFNDAIRLAALVGTGRMTWTEVNAALNARIKLAITRLRAGPGDGSARLDPHEAWEQAQRSGEDEIWASYHAKCDAVFAEDSSAEGIGRWSTARMRDNELVLGRLRNERDRALAELSRRLGRQPPRQASTTSPSSAVTARMQLASAERDALRKLDASGFIGSQSMADAILDLAVPLAGSIEQQRGHLPRRAKHPDRRRG